MRGQAIEPDFVTMFPQPLEPGVLYVSIRFSTAAHLCACGCGREVITPLSPAQWSVTFDGKVSVWPSIGNWALPCRSHYVIEDGNVRWARDFTPAEVNGNRQIDDHLLYSAGRPNPPWWQRRRFGRSSGGR
jgi:hypothetical protein